MRQIPTEREHAMTTITEDRMKRVEARLTAVEQAQNDNTQSLRFIVTTVAQMKAVQDDLLTTVTELAVVQERQGKVQEQQSKVQEQQGKVQEQHTKRFDRLEADIKGLRSDLPGIIADAMRDVLRDKKV
jgi:hypothetical protein